MSAEVSRTGSVVEELDGTDSGIIGNLGLNSGLFLAQLVNFLVVLLVLWRFAYRPLLKLLGERTAKIEGGLKMAKEMEERVSALESERATVLKAARDEGKKIVEQAETTAKERQEQAMVKAKEEVEKIVSTGKAQIANQKETMLNDAKAELASVIVEATRKVTSGAIDSKKADELAKESVLSAMTK